MRKSVWMVGAMLAASLGGCASTGVYEAETALHETFIVDTNSQAAFRRAGEYVRACHVNVAHPYNVAYAWKPKLGEKGAPDEVQVYKVGEQAKVLELITSEAESPSKAKVTITVVGEGRWDKAEIAAARASIERDAGLPPGRLIMEPRSGQGRAGAMAFALFAGAFRLLAWINGGAALVLVFFMLGVIGSDVAAPDLQAPLALYLAGFLGACGGSAVRLAGAGQPVATGRHPAARPAALAGPGAGRAFLCRERAVLLRRLLAGRRFRRHGRCLGDDGLHRRLGKNTGKPVCAKVLDLHLR